MTACIESARQKLFNRFPDDASYRSCLQKRKALTPTFLALENSSENNEDGNGQDESEMNESAASDADVLLSASVNPNTEARHVRKCMSDHEKRTQKELRKDEEVHHRRAMEEWTKDEEAKREKERIKRDGDRKILHSKAEDHAFAAYKLAEQAADNLKKDLAEKRRNNEKKQQ